MRFSVRRREMPEQSTVAASATTGRMSRRYAEFGALAPARQHVMRRLVPTTVIAAKTVVAAGVLALAATGTAVAFAAPTSRPDHATARVAAAHRTTHGSEAATTHRPTTAATGKDSSRGRSARSEASAASSREATTSGSRGKASAFGRCTAFAHGGLDSHSTAYAALVKAAGGAGVHAYCVGITHPGHPGGVRPGPGAPRPTDPAHKA
jgi:hypothetical protein